MTDAAGIAEHYASEDLTGRVAQALDAAGLGEGVIAWDALAPLDQFHVGGVAATRNMAERLAIPAGAAVLDIGCGLGGPARYLAAVHGCSVTGIDLNRHFVDLATMLTQRTGLSAKVSFRQADALALPFAPASFDLAWTQHVAMNIADRHGLYAGIREVLRPGGRLAIYDVVAGEGGPLHFPVPWARDPAQSFVVTAEAMRQAVEGAGFSVVDWADVTDQGVAWVEQQAKNRAAGTPPPPLGLPLLMGPDFASTLANLGANLVQRRARLVQAVVRM